MTLAREESLSLCLWHSNTVTCEGETTLLTFPRSSIVRRVSEDNDMIFDVMSPPNSPFPIFHDMT